MQANISIWEKESFFAPQDVIIVGGGLMGLWTAIALIENARTLRVTILEKNITPLGASTRNAGFACFGSPTELLHDAQKLGESAMLTITEKRFRGIEKITHYIPKNQIEYDPCGGYECITNDQLKLDTIADSIAYLNKLLAPITGTKRTFIRNDAALSTLGLQHFDALIQNKMEAGLHSGKLVQALQTEAISLGVQILSGIEVTECLQHNNGVQLHTRQNLVFTAEKVVLCTNAFSNNIFTGQTIPVTPGKGQIILTSPIENLPLHGTFHFDAGFYYWRNLGNRILLGGARNKAFEEETTTSLTTSATIQTALEDFLKTHLHPSIHYTIEQRWSGIMGFTDNHLPYIHFIEPNILAAIACNGMGVALTPIIAEEVADRLIQ
ncbi:MAG: FAD-binding oxidoreductase [Hydrotalea sp. AMD]|uniref:NAD(P)/FAD-dependent oxidoreductase n=1 Tax=Hydrotalea sp. AMD TaxID=2501297 RepID=UPI0009440E8C|nr:FAD-dependent oxidoreductase [Hydrotalea sp. AMD]RWZ89707.1 MAG: FAD-binding oxidoreductase [Hydrotalea sp. AMD]